MMESPHLYDPVKGTFAPKAEEFEAVEKSFIRRVRTGAPAVPVLSDFQNYAQVSLKPTAPGEHQPADPREEDNRGDVEDAPSNAAFMHQLSSTLDNKHLHRINSELMDMIEAEQQELRRLFQIQKQHEASMKQNDKDAQAVNALLLELVWHHRELIQNLQEVRSDSVHSETQALRLLKKVSKCVKKQQQQQ